MIEVELWLQGSYQGDIDQVETVLRGYPYQGWTTLIFNDESDFGLIPTFLEQHRGAAEYIIWRLGWAGISLAPAYVVKEKENA